MAESLVAQRVVRKASELGGLLVFPRVVSMAALKAALKDDQRADSKAKYR